MRKNIDIKFGFRNSNRIKSKNTTRHNWITIAIALYITFILITVMPFIAVDVIEPKLQPSYHYRLSYPEDGRQTHYYVERVDTTNLGKIDLTYTTAINSLQIKTENIDVLHIYCRSMYEDECREVFGFDPSDNSNYYKWYFIEKNHLTVSIESDNPMTELSFIDTPVPYEVYVNSDLWLEGVQYNYTHSYSTVLSNVPMGKTNVDIYFKSTDLNRPVASFKMDKTIINVNTLVYFDATNSYDPDGEIISYIWDFGDGNNSGGVLNSHKYTIPGKYCVILTVRDNDGLVDQTHMNITVLKGTNRPSINGIVPNQEKAEDSAPWELALANFGIDLDSSPNELRWYLTGENSGLYNVVGENSTDQKLIFSPLPNAFGNDLVTLWLVDKDGYSTNQPLWINLTPVNDKPVINMLPDLKVHYDVPYHFSISVYIHDVETRTEDLIVSAQDKFGNKYITINGQTLIFRYPKELMGEIILVTVTVSDGEDNFVTIISVTVSDNWPPIILKKLPNIELIEGTTKYDVFDLDDYFSDPDDEDLYFRYSQSNAAIFIKSNNSVDIISLGDWTGEEEVIFRAIDPYGAIVESSIKITILDLNGPPEIGNIPNLMVHYDLDYYFDVSYYITDSDNDFSELNLKTSDNEHIRISPKNNLGIILNYPKSMLGSTIQVVLTVSDGELETSKTVSVTVIEEYPPELVKKLPDVVFLEDESLIDHFCLDDYFLDLDNDTLYYTTGNVMINITISPEHLVSFFSPPDWFGTETVIFRATDPVGALVEDVISVSVLSVKDPPQLLPLPTITLNEKETLEFDLTPYIIDPDTNLSNLIIFVNHENVFIKGSSLVLFGSKDLAGELRVNISDGEFMDSGILIIEIKTKEYKEADVSSLIAVFIVIIIIIIVSILLVLRHIYWKMKKFEVEEIFLIHNSGKLITHVCTEAHSKFDDEIFSGMFTAIQGFIEESFSNEGPLVYKQDKLKLDPIKSDLYLQSKKPMKLNEFKVGGNQVLIEHGRYIFMAVVYEGQGKSALHKVIKDTINVLETEYSPALEYWIGDMKELEGIDDIIKPLLSEKENVSKAKTDNLKTTKVTSN